jgi:heat shock protein HslJ
LDPALANLLGRQWQLVAIQSMDDAIGRRVPRNPSDYTLRFGHDGTATLRLDCNRGEAPWQVSAALPLLSVPGGEVSGSLRLGPLALTRALCPKGSLSNDLARQLPYVRSFLLRGDRLYLSLMADGGILEWQPLQGVPFRSRLTAEERAAILQGLDPFTRQLVAREPERHRVVVARIDLNGDGRQELLAYLMGPHFCGSGGCTLQLLTPLPPPAAGGPPAAGTSPAAAGQPGGWRLLQSFSITRLPLIIGPASNKGWRDLWRPESGGGAPRALVRERFDGQRYRPSERRPPEPPPAGTAVFVGDPGLEDGAPLATDPTAPPGSP